MSLASNNAYWANSGWFDEHIVTIYNYAYKRDYTGSKRHSISTFQISIWKMWFQGHILVDIVVKHVKQ